MKDLTVTLSIDVDDPLVMAKVSESFARTLAGLAMEGIFGMLYIDESFTAEDDDLDDDED